MDTLIAQRTACRFRFLNGLLCLIVLASAVVSGCASKGFIKDDRFINTRFGFTFRVPEGWAAQGCLPDSLLPVATAARFEKLHHLLSLSNQNGRGCLLASAGRSLYSYELYTAELFNSAPEKVFQDYSPGLRRSEESALRASREAKATDPVDVTGQWNRHFQSFQDTASRTEVIRGYTRYKQDFGLHPGFHEQWTAEADGRFHTFRQETVFFRCREDDACFVSLTLVSPTETLQQNAAGLKAVLNSFERFFDFERPY